MRKSIDFSLYGFICMPRFGEKFYMHHYFKVIVTDDDAGKRKSDRVILSLSKAFRQKGREKLRKVVRSIMPKGEGYRRKVCTYMKTGIEQKRGFQSVPSLVSNSLMIVIVHLPRRRIDDRRGVVSSDEVGFLSI